MIDKDAQDDRCPFTGKRDTEIAQARERVLIDKYADVKRLYSARGGPLIGWLQDEARRRCIDEQGLAASLGCTSDYFTMLRLGLRKTSDISHEFAVACGRFLHVPTIMVLILAGFITMRDFSLVAISEEEVLDRALRRVLDDPHFRETVPVDVMTFTLDAKKAVIFMYEESTGADLMGFRRLPEMVKWLQRATFNHEATELEVEAEAVNGYRDTAFF